MFYNNSKKNNRILSIFSFLLIFSFFVLSFYPLKSFADIVSYDHFLPYPSGTKLRVIQGYNGWFSHSGNLAKGLDFAANYSDSSGTPILATKAGKVVSAKQGGKYDYNCKNLRDCQAKGMRGQPTDDYNYTNGNLVVIDHGNRLTSHYYHLQPGSISVKYGDYVSQGQMIGRLGNTGLSTRPHLHYHVWQDSQTPVDVRFVECGNCTLRNNWVYTSNNRVPDNYGIVTKVKSLKVRNKPGGSIVTSLPAGTKGVILDGPKSARLGQYNYSWIKIRWENGYEGWSVDLAEYLQIKK